MPRAKTLWDWMQLLLVPLAVTGAAGWLNWVQSAREAEREDRRANIEADREARREQDAVMDAYLSQIANLLLHEDLGQPTSEGKRAKQVACGQTLTALRRIDGDHASRRGPLRHSRHTRRWDRHA